MYKSFDESKFRQALAEKNHLYVKTCVTSAIKNNPNFTFVKGGTKSEAGLAFDEIEASFPEAIMPYKLFDGEVLITSSNVETSTEELFYSKCFRLERNFCRKRYNELVQIGQYLVKQRTFPMPQEQTTAESNAPITTQESHKKIPLPVKIALIAAAVLLVALVAKMMV